MSPDPTRRVLVVGAGPAGLTAAMTLRKRGYDRVTVLENTDSIGGKCHSLHYEGQVYDLGANLTTPRYTLIRPLAERMGLHERELPPRRITSVNGEKAPTAENITALQRLFIRAATEVYVLARGTTGIDREGFAGLGAGVKQPFQKWLEHHGLAPFREVFANLFVAYGYGVMDDLPAAYALKFFDPIHIHTAVRVIFGDTLDTTRVFTEGFQELWVRVVKQWSLDVRTQAEITSIVRDKDGVTVQWTHPGGEEKAHFDVLILACPLDATLPFLDASTTERRLFEKIEHDDYYVTAAVLKGIPDASVFVYPYSMHLTPNQPTVFYPPVPGEPNDVFMFYSYGTPDTTVDEVRDNLAAMIQKPPFSGQVEKFITTKHWKYFPHVSVETMQAGFFDDLEAIQGTNHTWYVGEILSFTLVELVSRYAENLIQSWF